MKRNMGPAATHVYPKPTNGGQITCKTATFQKRPVYIYISEVGGSQPGNRVPSSVSVSCVTCRACEAVCPRDVLLWAHPLQMSRVLLRLWRPARPRRPTCSAGAHAFLQRLMSMLSSQGRIGLVTFFFRASPYFPVCGCPAARVVISMLPSFGP